MWVLASGMIRFGNVCSLFLLGPNASALLSQAHLGEAE